MDLPAPLRVGLSSPGSSPSPPTLIPMLIILHSSPLAWCAGGCRNRHCTPHPRGTGHGQVPGRGEAVRHHVEGSYFSVNEWGGYTNGPPPAGAVSHAARLADSLFMNVDQGPSGARNIVNSQVEPIISLRPAHLQSHPHDKSVTVCVLHVSLLLYTLARSLAQSATTSSALAHATQRPPRSLPVPTTMCS